MTKRVLEKDEAVILKTKYGTTILNRKGIYHSIPKYQKVGQQNFMGAERSLQDLKKISSQNRVNHDTPKVKKRTTSSSRYSQVKLPRHLVKRMKATAEFERFATFEDFVEACYEDYFKCEKLQLRTSPRELAFRARYDFAR